MIPAIEVNNLCKIYEGGLEALKGINLTIPQGSFYGLLGPNGAGKTTTIGIITGLVNITSGSATIMGYDSVNEFRQARKLIGLSPQELNFDVFFSIGELLELQAGYYGLSNKEAKERTTIMLEQFGLSEKRNSRARELSGGMKRRVQIAKALVHDPPIIILDEPTAGVDIELRHMLWDYLRRINKEGKTILLTTHYIEEAERLCETISIINDGNIIVTNSPENLTQAHGMSGLEITLTSKLPDLKLNPWKFNITDNKIHVDMVRPEKEMASVINQISEQGGGIENVRIYRSSLEDVFLKLTGKSLQDDEEKNETQEDLLNV
jgi:ABC-2 type transport system ATP-binding protein